MKTPLPTLPPELWAIRDAAIEHALNGAPPPQDLSRLLEWLEGDGWGALLADWEDSGEPVALDLTEVAQRCFLDSELRWPGRDEEITDDERVEHARSVLDSRLGESCSESPNVHAYTLESDDGKAATVGCTAWLMGQGGL